MTRKRKNNAPLFSIITINYNTLDRLRKTTESVVSQTYKNFEFIIVDGGSTDGSAEYIQKNSHLFTKWVSESDKNRYDGMNKGIKMASGKYLLFLNSGDTLYDKNVLANFAKRKLTEKVYFGNLLVDNCDGKELFEVDFGNRKVDLDLLLKYALPHQATFFHNSLFSDYGMYDDSYTIHADHDYFLKLIKNEVKIQHLPIRTSIFKTDGISYDEKFSKQSIKEKSKTLDSNFGYPMIHFFTIVLYGQPFIEYHINILKKLPFKWHWHIIEGAANLTHDTAWSILNGGKMTNEFHNQGRSVDGTGEYLDKLKKKFPDNVTIYRKPLGTLWDGKIEMVRAPLPNIKEECLLWEIDADEYWTADQIIRVRELFMNHPEKTAAYYMSHVFVGDNLVLKSFNTYGNTLKHEWLRTWKFKPGDDWMAHEPPMLCRTMDDGTIVNLSDIDPFEHIETASNGLTFQHFAYVTNAQLRFKECIYGYTGALDKWKNMQKVKKVPFLLRDYLDWVTDDTMVDTAQNIGIVPLLQRDEDGQWKNTFDTLSKIPNIDNYNYLLAQLHVKEKRNLKYSLLEAQNTLNKTMEDLNQISNSRGWRFITRMRNVRSRLLRNGGIAHKMLLFAVKSARFIYRLIRKTLIIKQYCDKFIVVQKVKYSIKKMLGRKTLQPLKPQVPPYQYTPYDFITWLRFANAGMQSDGNIYSMEYAIANLPSNSPIVEIGSFCGLSTNLITFYLLRNKRKNKVFTCDKWVFEGGEDFKGKLGGAELTNKEYSEFVKNTYIKNITFFSKHNLPYTVEVFSDDFFEMWREEKKVKDVLNRNTQLGGPISFAYIDGNHSYEYAKSDFENVDRHLELGGFILFDDSADGSGWGVCKVIDEIKKDDRYEVIIQNPNYLIRKVK